MRLSKAAKKSICELMERYPQKRSALIPALHIAQKEIGYLPREIQQEIADLFSIHVSEVTGVVTFYDMFSEEPRAKKQVYLCKNLSCMLLGADEIKAVLQKKLADSREYTLHLAECLGACDKAPVMICDEKVVGPLTKEAVERHFPENPHAGESQ